MWSFTSSDGIQVERYIVEFECRVRNITFVEKYTSVSASGGTGRVATSVSCFGGLGQLYRVKVWSVSVDQASVNNFGIAYQMGSAVQKGRWEGYDYMALYILQMGIHWSAWSLKRSSKIYKYIYIYT